MKSRAVVITTSSFTATARHTAYQLVLNRYEASRTPSAGSAGTNGALVRIPSPPKTQPWLSYGVHDADGRAQRSSTAEPLRILVARRLATATIHAAATAMHISAGSADGVADAALACEPRATQTQTARQFHELSVFQPDSAPSSWSAGA